jgi:hypothetical protein
MLFGSAVVVALLVAGAGQQTKRPTATHLWLSYAHRPVPHDFAPKLPFELKSIKVVGASGFGVFFPIADNLSVGAGVSSMKIGPGPHERAMQFVGAIRFRF